MSKLITVAAAARLKQDGALNVDQPVASILPYLSPNWAPLTTRQLAAHVAGLPHYQAIDAQLGKVRYSTVRDAVSIFKNRDLLSSPGSKYSYSSWGYTLLSAVAEERAGVPFLDYVAKRITPGLVIVPDVTDSGNPAASSAYEFVDGQARLAASHVISYTWAGGGFDATPKSLVEFGGRMIGGKIVSSATFAWMLQPAKLNDGSLVMEGENIIGFGWRTGKDADGDRIAHYAGVTIGARSALVVWPDRSLAVSLLSNTLWVSSIEQSAMIIAAPFKPTPAGIVAANCPVKATRYAGRFADANVGGIVRFVVDGGICIGDIVVDKPMSDFFNAFPQKDAQTLRAIGIDATGVLSRATIVTPIGAYDLRAKPDGTYSATFGAKRVLVLAFN